MNLTKKTIIAAASILLVLSSASGFTASAAAAPQKQTKTQPAAKKSSLEQQKKAAMDIVHSKEKKPGDLTVLYDGTDSSLSFYYRAITSSDYDEYTKLLTQYKAPELKQPEWLPEGYVFQTGEIVPPYYHFLSEPYQKMLKEFKAEAKGKKYYAKKLKWSEAGETALVFAKDSDIIRVNTKKMHPLITEVTRVPGKGEKFEKLSIGGTEALYSTNSDALYSTMLKWEDAENQLEYEISTYKKSPLTKEDLAAVAESIIMQSKSKSQEE
ncbi:DUF4367 domain-containing protein [Paenibacillus oralis]|uniref:DUF4367 domain-containing protein n=1 Tax=Paenibacillus oralis TaxID=2490856 RepID=A0A3P3UC03_9BACL|nr:DUF4367 domain-containing protein [Paenibacillus oralis]RRJ65983.1 DUF4367 domain-containing protein [Paenibacillus oralis]